jgi:hypothetical protein
MHNTKVTQHHDSSPIILLAKRYCPINNDKKSIAEGFFLNIPFVLKRNKRIDENYYE